MIHKERIERPDYIFPPHPWKLIEKKLSPPYIGMMETLFSTANGYIGIRGSQDEGTSVKQEGTFINGFYETWPIPYGENAFGLAKTGQTIVKVPDATIFRLFVDDEPFTLSTATLLRYERALDMQRGVLTREILWETPGGKKLEIKSKRLVSLTQRHVAAISYEVKLLNKSAPITILSEIANRPDKRESIEDPRQSRKLSPEILQTEMTFNKDRRLIFGQKTVSSKMTIASGVDHLIECDAVYDVRSTHNDQAGQVVLSTDLSQNQTVRITKFITYHTSRSAGTQDLVGRAHRTLNRAQYDGFQALLKSQKSALDKFWHYSDVEIRGEASAQQAIRFNLYHLCQATARTDGIGVPAKGMTGAGYEGHYFWDTEIYVMPFLTYTNPRIAKNLLQFRHGLLGKARERAQQVNQKGALYPWRTINGEEASAYYAAGTAQYHLNADIIYALKKYYEVTGDQDFLFEYGAEMLVETARLWYDLGFFSKNKEKKFEIHGVTGPDEYNTVVNNNTYTNLMARENLWFAAQTLKDLQKRKPARFEALVHETKLNPDEIQDWKTAADKMYVPYDEEKKINPQDDSFLEKEPWDFAHTPPEKYPLLLHYHPLVIYRYQVIKQGDIILALFLLGDEFTAEQKKRNFDFYDPMTTGDSSLSACIQSIMACEVGYMEKAREYARSAALMDLADIQGNVEDGCHIASMGGTWMTIVYGFAGLRDYGGKISFHPKMSGNMDGLKFKLQIQGRLLQVEMDRLKNLVTYQLLEGSSLTIHHYNKPLQLKAGVPLSTSAKLFHQKVPIPQQVN